ncbi:aminopeptidase [Acerihabitans sp. TG2]|uniref:aminopeptidase n=1 Tax=Acerihabitans sp. TG2 TaxID=3096008 RepID=UPI002B230671|nr:aminopeptidase [Acerihabitans sp. TG2]MEA9392770.1 aminopeptidase [Acerihabitans sp. TG2]
MFHPGRSTRARLTWCFGCLLAASTPAAAHTPGHFAEEQIRYIATYFPGRMSGSPAELMAADYLRQRFSQLGFHSDLRAFNTRYQFHGGEGKDDRRKITTTSVIAAKAGSTPGEVLIIAHSDTFMPRSDKDLNANLGGLSLQGVDDNASGLGVMLGLAQQLSKTPLMVGVRFVALSAGEPSTLGADNYLQRMSPQEKRNTLLVINLDSLIGGDKLRVDYNPDSGDSRLKILVKNLGNQARQAGIPLIINARIKISADCPSDALPFAKAGFPVIDVGSGITGNSCRQRRISRNFPQGMVRYQGQLDNIQNLDTHLTGQISKRARDSMKLLWPLLQEVTQVVKAR